ncbi:MAG: transposase [Muribaculaceae bacterium]|nr:transposase [Muribaculaceae bacterium]
MDAFIEDMAVRLFYVRSGKHAPWCGILTTDTSLDFHKAYELYAMRWSIEVIFKDCKQNLGLGKCQSRDFSAQIAHSTIAFLQYNILSTARRFSGYETIGGLFKDVCQDTMELTVCQRIWEIICEIASVIAETFDIGNDKVIETIVKDSDKLSHIFKLCSRLNAA